jgi:hypothetical protein
MCAMISGGKNYPLFFFESSAWKFLSISESLMVSASLKNESLYFTGNFKDLGEPSDSVEPDFSGEADGPF